jgi:hypothetical protein
MGSEHAISSPDRARQWLQREIAEMGSGPDESMIDPISVDGQIVRVHLRPFIGQGGDPETLLNAFIQTANEYRGEIQVLKDHWKTATEIQCFPCTEMDEFLETMQTQYYPAVHHSHEYERLYRPAYRVVWRKFIV